MKVIFLGFNLFSLSEHIAPCLSVGRGAFRGGLSAPGKMGTPRSPKGAVRCGAETYWPALPRLPVVVRPLWLFRRSALFLAAPTSRGVPRFVSVPKGGIVVITWMQADLKPDPQAAAFTCRSEPFSGEARDGGASVCASALSSGAISR